MNKILKFIKSLSTPKKKSHVTIDEFGGSHFDVSAFLRTPEGRKMFDYDHEFWKTIKGGDFMTEKTWYLLYAGTTADGMGDGNYCGRTTDKETARKHWDECKRNPYSVGKVIAVTDTTHRRIVFNYDWDSYK